MAPRVPRLPAAVEAGGGAPARISGPEDEPTREGNLEPLLPELPHQDGANSHTAAPLRVAEQLEERPLFKADKSFQRITELPV